MNTAASLKERLTFGFGDRLAKSLEASDTSNNEMAAYLGKSRTTISNWIHGRAPISRGDLVAWALKTGVPLEWLETGHFPEDKTPRRIRAGGNNSGPGGTRNPDPLGVNMGLAPVIPLFQKAA